MKGELLWVYEGLTTYLGTVLTARSGLWTPEQARDDIAATAAMLDHRSGREWRPLRDTADAAQVLYFAPSEWVSERRGTDFYPESVLLWLDADVTIRRLTHGRRSLDDFCRSFLGGPDQRPVMKPYSYDDLITAMNAVAPHDWRAFFHDRVDVVAPHPPMDGINEGGWRLTYGDAPNSMLTAAQQAFGAGNFISSLGLMVTRDGNIQDVVPGMPAFASGLAPYMRIIGTNGRKFSVEELDRVVQKANSTQDAIELTVFNTSTMETHRINYHGGTRHPHLERAAGTDYISAILQPLNRTQAPAPR